MTETNTQPGLVALVTGAAHGIGAAIATRLASQGWRVVAADKDTPPSPNPAIRYALADVAEEADIAALIAGIENTEGRLDALISNAGLMIRKKLHALTPAEWNRVIATNLTATFLLARAAENLLRRQRGAIVTMASTRAHMSEPDTESYAASKGGLLALTHALAISLGPEVRVNCVSPGWIDVANEELRQEDHTQHPAGRVGRPQDVASLVAWLLDPAQGFVTGAEFVIDGGMTRKMIYEP